MDLNASYLCYRILYNMKKLLPFLLITLFSSSIYGQLQVTSNMTVAQYVQDVLLGVNVTVSNITYNGASADVVVPAIGSFESNGSNLEIQSGFLMSSGNASAAPGPNNTNSAIAFDSFTYGDDPDLMAITDDPILDWSIIEFDFVPLGDTLRFNYIWASEEYPEYTNGSVNDAFGFIISGPGINGTFSNNGVNIALIPGTDVPVSINNLNNGSDGVSGPCEYCEYYNGNGTGWDTEDPTYTDPFTIVYDGYTNKLTAIGIVQCGLTYHIKLAICDGGDAVYDSAVFLERDSFSSNLVVQATLELDVAGPDGQTLFENCGDGNLVFERPESGIVNTPVVAYLGYSGTAINGVDYTLMPDSVVFPPGVMTVSVFIDGFADGITEGTETVHIEIENIAECGEALLSSSFDFVIVDIAEPLVVEGVNYEICSGETQTLEPIITGGYAVYQYDWSTGENTATIDVSPLNTTTYMLTVSDTCGMPSDDAQFIVNVIVVPTLTVDLVDQDLILPLDCEEFGNVYAVVNGGVLPYQYEYSDDQGGMLWGFENTLGISSWNAGMIYVEITDECGFVATDSLQIDVNAPPLFANLVAPATVGCNEAYTAEADASGGYVSFGYSYTWAVNGVTDWWNWTDIFSGTATEANFVLSVTVSDNCGQTVTDEANITTLSPPISITIPEPNIGTCNTVFNIQPDIQGGSGDLSNWSYTWLANSSVIGNTQQLTSSFAQTTDLTLNAFDMCGVQGTGNVTVQIDNPAISVDLGEDINTSCISTTDLVANYAGGSGGVTYQWTLNGNAAGTLQNYSLQTFETADVSVLVADACGQSASDQIFIIIPDVPLELSIAPEQHICPGDSASVWAIATGGEGGFGYQWNNGSMLPTYTDFPELSTTYTVVATDICGKTISGEIHVGVHPVVADFTTTKLGENEYEFVCTTTPVDEIASIFWDFGDDSYDNSLETGHTFDGLDTYTVSLTVTNFLGCQDEGSVEIMPSPILYIPTSFTPNNDGLNDVWKVEGRAIKEFDIKIFNRWGVVIYASNDPNDVWLGDNEGTGEYYVQNNVYSYIVRVKGFDGETITKKGSITMMR